jgi:4-amino-4-deoxy-L-arabinose transferase-like glycosyltransferase
VQWFIDIGAALGVYLLGRALAGRLAAALALAAYLAHPAMMAYSGSIMTETTAVALSALSLWLCAVACEPRRSLRTATRALCGAGVAVALGMLVRADGVLLGPCLLLPLILRREPLRARGHMVALTLLCALVTYSPWVLRNLHTFGAPYAFGSLCEIDGTPIERTWFHSWYASWVRTEFDLLSTQGCIYKRTCATSMIMFPEYAFDSDAERMRVYELLWQHSSDGMSKSIDDEFHELWRQKVRRHPLRTLVIAPAYRFRHLWLGANDLPTRARPPEQPTRLPRSHYLYGRLAQVSAWLALSGLCALLLPVWQGRRKILWLALLAIGVRSGFLALLGFPEPRYILELVPLTLVLGGIALATPLRLWALARAGSGPDRF